MGPRSDTKTSIKVKSYGLKLGKYLISWFSLVNFTEVLAIDPIIHGKQDAIDAKGVDGDHVETVRWLISAASMDCRRSPGISAFA